MNERSLLEDIKSGKGLPPITPSNTDNNTPGLTTEHRAEDVVGLCTERFTKSDNENDKGEK